MSGGIGPLQIEWRLGFKEERGPDLSRITPGLVGGRRRTRWKGSQSGSGWGGGGTEPPASSEERGGQRQWAIWNDISKEILGHPRNDCA